MTRYKVSLLVDFPDDMHMEDVIENVRDSTVGEVLSIALDSGFRIGYSGMTKDIKLEQHQCEHCGRFFYINKNDKSGFDFGFGCPYGCDDNGKHTRTILVEIKEVTEMDEESH